MSVLFVKRLGPTLAKAENQCYGTYGCPDIWEMADGDFAIIGADITELVNQLPPSAGCATGERMVKIPRKVLMLAKPYIPDSV